MAWYLSYIIEQLTDSGDIISPITNPVIVPTRSNYSGEEVHRWFKLQLANVFCKARDALFTTENLEHELLKDKEMQRSFLRSLAIGVVLLLDLIFQRSRACFSWNNPVALPDLYFYLSLWPVAPIAKGVGDIVSVALSVVSLLHSPITRCVWRDTGSLSVWRETRKLGWNRVDSGQINTVRKIVPKLRFGLS